MSQRSIGRRFVPTLLWLYRRYKLFGNANTWSIYRITSSYLASRPGRRDVIVEVGGGNGALLQALGKRLRARLLVSTDLAPSDATTLVCDAQALPFSNESVNVLFAFEVLEHVPDPDLMLREAARVLVSYGELVISVPFVYGQHDAADYTRFTAQGLERRLTLSGFGSVQIRRRGGTFLAIVLLLSELIHRLVVGNSEAWRARDGSVMRRQAVATVLRAPLDALTWVALLLDVAVDRRSRSSAGFVVVARRLVSDEATSL